MKFVDDRCILNDLWFEIEEFERKYEKKDLFEQNDECHSTLNLKNEIIEQQVTRETEGQNDFDWDLFLKKVILYVLLIWNQFEGERNERFNHKE